MYEYKFVEVSLGGFFTDANHHQVIDKHAKEGWRLVQVLATGYNSHGKPTGSEAVFEREIREKV